MTYPRPVNLRYDIHRCRNKRGQWAHPVLLLGTALDTCERCDTIIDDDANLLVRDRLAFED